MPRSLFPILAAVSFALALAGCENKQFSSVFSGSKAPPPASAPPQPLGQPAPQPQTAAPLPPGEFPPVPSTPGEDRLTTEPPVPRVLPDVPRVAILLPLSGPNAPLGEAMLNAAQLALFQFADRRFELLPQDTRGTPDGAAEAAQLAISDGASLILGPLLSTEVEAITPAVHAAGVRVLAFTNDRRVASEGVYVMGFRPDEQVERVMKYAYSRGLRRFAVLAPDDAYGHLIASAMQATAQQIGAQVTQAELYDPQASDVSNVVRRLANYDARRAQLLAEREELQKRGDDEVAKAALVRLSTLQTLGDVPFDALLIADDGQRLAQIAAYLPYYDIDPKKTRILGTSRWDVPGIGKEPALLGAWFAAPSPSARAGFEKQYADVYGRPPARLATLAYDATAIAALFAKPGSVDVAALTSPQGFAGRDGVFRFLSDGVTERGLAVEQVTVGNPQIVSEAPTTFQQATN